jgi:hypothetical protein
MLRLCRVSKSTPRVAFLALGAVLLAGAGGCGKKASSVTVPLTFRPTSQMNMNTFAGDLPESTVFVGQVTDARERQDQVGENLEEKNPVPVFASGTEPTEFVRGVMNSLLTRAGLQLGQDQGQAERVLLTDLHHFWTQETNTYEAEVRATVTVQDRGGRQLWKGTVNGTAERFGRSLKAENYQEVFSDATLKMVEGLLNNPGFRAALGKDAQPAAQR